MKFGELMSWSDIKKEAFIVEHILWDIMPKELMEPSSRVTDKGVQMRETIKGYVFYIDTMDKNPLLFLMRHTEAGYAETLAQIDEIPQELLVEAVKENKGKVYFSMYPINKKVEGWLKRELGVL